MTDVHDPEFRELMKGGVRRVAQQLDSDLPLVGTRLVDWVKSLAGTEEPADYFLHPVAFPLMLLPWWLERQLNGHADPAFQSDLIFSNASLYYYIRLVDNVMDGHATVEPKLLPTAGYLADRFQRIYTAYFDPRHPFWDFFHSTWAEFCDITAADGHLAEIDTATFENLVSRKVCAAKISVAAVCFRNSRPDLLPAWDSWIDLFGRWHLFREDLFDWQQDLTLGVATYFLSEAKRRKRPEEPEVGWLAREGLDWGFSQLQGWMRQLRQMSFASQEVSAYLDFREQELFERRETLRPALEFINQLTGSNQL